MAIATSQLEARFRAPDRLGLKLQPDSSATDLLCCQCAYPVTGARQIINCGCRICEECFSWLEKGSNMSVCCKKCSKAFDMNKTFRDKAIDSELKRKKFPCFHQKCPWEGTAFNYKGHTENCKYAKIKCRNVGCGAMILKSSQKEHDSQCQFRPVVCLWCGKEVQSVDKQNHELKDCLEFVLPCPLGCGETMIRRKMMEHVDLQCQNQTQLCAFAHFGCTTKGTFNQLSIHGEENIVAHLEYLAKTSSIEPSNIQMKIEETNKKILLLQSEVRTIKDDTSKQINVLSEGAAKLDGMLQDVRESFQELSVLVQTLQATSYNGQYVWKIPEVKRRREEAIMGKTLSLYSAPFYTSRFGYKMCLRLYMDGDGSGKGSHISFFLTIMRGEYDALLSWPFSQLVTLTLLDQTKEKHITQCFRPEPSSSSFWRPNSEMNVAAGCPKFAPISILAKSKYVQEDTMFFKVVVDTTGLIQLN